MRTRQTRSNHKKTQLSDCLTPEGSNIFVSISGSLCKFRFGHNVSTLSPRDAADAIEEIGDLLHLPIRDARVTQLHLAHNLTMNLPPACYFPLLGTLLRHQRGDWDGRTLYFTNSLIQLCFYDKCGEQRSHRQRTPTIPECRNLLRYELRLKRDIKNRLNWSVPRATDLSKKEFYDRCVTLWEETFFAIEKYPKPMPLPESLNQKSVLLWLAATGVETLGGLGPVLAIVDTAMADASPSSRYRARCKIRKLSRLRGDDSLINELDSKIREATMSLRLWSRE